MICAIEYEALADLLCRRLLSTVAQPGRRVAIDTGDKGSIDVVSIARNCANGCRCAGRKQRCIGGRLRLPKTNKASRAKLRSTELAAWIANPAYRAHYSAAASRLSTMRARGALHVRPGSL